MFRLHAVTSLRLLTLALMCCATVALAYVLPAASILRRLAEERDQLRLFTLRIEGTASFFAEGAREAGSALGLPHDRGEVQTDAAVLFKAPGRCRFELNPLEGNRSAAVHADLEARAEGKPVPAIAMAVEEICAFHALRSDSEADGRVSIERHLKARGVDLAAETWLARFGGQVAYVIGKQQDGAPQAWVYKDSFFPARIRYTDTTGAAWDVRFFDYSSPVSGEWFPRTIEVLRDAKLLMRFTGLHADNKSKLDDALF